MKKIIILILLVTLFLGCATTRVNINTNVDDAKIIVNGRWIGQTPLNAIKMRNSNGIRYQIIIEKEGYKTYRGYLEKENNGPALVAVIIGYSLSFLLVPALLLINAQYLERPVQDQYFVLEEIN